MLAEDSKRTVVETLKAFRQAYPVGDRHPHDEAAWQKVGAILRTALKTAPADVILAGVDRYAASGEDPAYIRDPKNWLKGEDWRKPYPPKTPRASARAAANGYDAAKPHLDLMRAAAARGPKTDVSGI